jgi:hypothetical protein
MVCGEKGEKETGPPPGIAMWWGCGRDEEEEEEV